MQAQQAAGADLTARQGLRYNTNKHLGQADQGFDTSSIRCNTNCSKRSRV